MSELLGYSILAFGAGLLLNFVPCVLPIIPVKIYTVLREIKGDIRSRILAAVSLLAGTMSFFLILGGATAYLELAWGDLFRSKLFLAGLTAFFLFAGIATSDEALIFFRPLDRLDKTTSRICFDCRRGLLWSGFFTGSLTSVVMVAFLSNDAHLGRICL